MIEPRVGTAGWTIPRDVRDRFHENGTQLERYARRFSCVEINSSFYRPHRPTTYARWAASVPETFRFALKLPKAITHDKRLVDVADPLERFLEESAALGERRDVILVQLPPSLSFDATIVAPFFDAMRARYAGKIACEPRHVTWFRDDVDATLRAYGVARVAADPPVAGEPFGTGGSHDFAYWRLHGSPRTYYSTYDDARLASFAAALRNADRPAWCIFDNTTLGFATTNALTVLEATRASRGDAAAFE